MSPSRALPAIGLVLLVTTIPSASVAEPPIGHEAEVARCIRQSAKGKPWLEVTLWGLRDQEGGWAGAAISNANGSEDLGPLQINSWWVPKLAALKGNSLTDVRRRLAEDICFNVDAARWIFLTALFVNHDFWLAVGAYHSPKPSRQRHYALAVAEKLRRRFGPDIFKSPRSRLERAKMESGK